MSASDKSVMHAIEFLQERPKDTPFALTVAYYPPKAVGASKEPGGQWFPKESSKALYANTTYEPPYDVEKAHADLPDFLKKKIMRNRYLERWDTTEKYNTGMRNYHALVTEVDLASSQIVEELKRQGLYENTMIIFTSDNGLMMGSHGLGGKWIAYEESIRVPLIIYDPRMPSEKRGSVDNSMTLNIDLASTILGAANIAPPEAMQGRDIADLYLSSNDGTSKLKEKPWRTEYLYEYPIWSLSQNSLIGERYKYIHWMGFQSEQLFDIQEDPFELNDLIKQVSKDEAEVDSNHIAQMEKLAVGLFETLHGVKVTISELHDLLKEKGIAVGQNKSESEEATLKELIEALISELKIRYENVRNEVQGPGGKPDWCDPSLEYP
ncbi:unnamed protein product [Pseudo-nitzschia multistriata]|uniref:N-sulphoglucosamine sulphohydrolase C-terminal domain-containing protein n=1 Tax=Pseudo-nitzschia multistriata TaxID=183589 RepID=A0A448Z9C5_9STRA|nr:unnamed protein product [Pseudo-nitzschia multistriata]